MKSFIHKKLVPAVLAVCFLSMSFYALSVPKPVQADGAAACKGGMVVAIAQLAWATIKGTVSAQVGTESPTQHFLGNYKDAGAFINDCVLKPLAQMMLVALIRNIGASVVKWVNSGFEGKPAFVTDFGGTLLDAADQAAGTFIEGNTDLGFLCSPFSFQVRLNLALKYSQPFNDQVRCTLTDIGNNIDNFANNNGGAGWDNWLKVSTEPQNNLYGASLIADSELTKRMASAVDIKKDRISLGSGFLDFDTCDEYESAADIQARRFGTQTNYSTGAITSISATSPTGLSGISNVSSAAPSLGSSNGFGGSNPFDKTSNVDTSAFGPQKTDLTASFNKTIADTQAITDSKPQCKPGKMTTKTPGQVIASQLNSEFASGPIQRAVAQEIDQVIAATMNQLAQKAVQGASGLLGLSKKKQASSVSYIDQYRAKFYGQGTTATINNDTGAQSDLDAYTVANYEDALALRNDPTNTDVQSIDQFTNTVGGEQIQAQENQVNNTVVAYAGTSEDRNIAIGKISTESSVLNPAANGNDGVKQTTQYVKGAETASDEAGGWWEVDLGANKSIKQINIFAVSTPSAPNGGLGTFSVDVRDETGSATTYTGSTFTQNTNTGSLTGTVGRTGRYVRITRQASATSCSDDYYGDRYSSAPCIDQPHLAFSELEVIETPDSSSAATSTPSTSNNSSTPVANNATATSTLSWNPQVTSARVSASSAMSQEIQLSTGKSVSGIVAEIALYNANGQNIPFSNVFANFDILRGPTGGSWVSSQSVITPTVGTLRVGISINQNSSFSFKLTGSKQSSATKGNYSFVTRVSDSTGTVLEDKTQRINFVVE